MTIDDFSNLEPIELIKGLDNYQQEIVYAFISVPF